MSVRICPRRLALSAILATCSTSPFAAASTEALRLPDHYEFDATLATAFQADARGQFPIRLGFDFPGGYHATLASWQVDVISPKGQVLRRWIGEAPLANGRGERKFNWDGRDAQGQNLPAGFYTVRLQAVPSVRLSSEQTLALAERVKRSFQLGSEEQTEQRFDIRIGEVALPSMPSFGGLGHGAATRAGKGGGAIQSVAAATLPYTIYYGNLHSQTNHSDGGAPVASCSGSEVPQGGQYGPTDAYAMMDVQAGGDFLLASEHNHMYDGSTGTNTAADPTTANNLFGSGLSAAATYTGAHPDFMALYGNEWGVISNGGHLNIINPDALPSWEYNASGQLIGSVATIKSNYADLYATMKSRGWIGQFNHPSTSQFAIGGIGMAYDANGAEVMVLAEIRNSSAFSVNTSETETGGSTYQSAFNTLLERGYKVAPATNQDNHCANWGLSFRNRTGVLLPTGSALTPANFLDALKARRVFASEDKTAQLVLTGNGLVMGQTLANSGALTLAANYASSSGQVAARVQFFEGVPGRNGAVTQLYEGDGSYTFTPNEGAHFYYAQVTETDGDRLWSAPIWIEQGAGAGDTIAPTVSASETGSSGTITLSANASDNVGVSTVEFYVDGVLKGSDASSPYSMTLDSTTLNNGSHTLTANASDAAGNIGNSTAVVFTIDNPVPDTSAPTVSASETGSSGTITLSANASDNVGVSTVEFYVDGVLKGSDASSPYSMTLDSTTLIDGSHSLIAQAYDAAGNQAASTPVSFTISNAPAVERIVNGGFESGKTGWAASNGVITKSNSYAGHSGSWKAWLNGYGTTNTEYLRQSVAIPATTTRATLSFWLRVASDETSTTTAYDTLKVQVRNSSGSVLATLRTYSNLDKGNSYVQRSFDLLAYKGQTIQLYFEGKEGALVVTSFLIDDVSVQTQ